ncbi:hypothetical protein I79_004881 [Cricetulus griseus]|uniref:Uncharacterized protein n=1 Tax=Cricetulus griseus TaxID=10029 RepID=G3H3Q2_CRIGR|nr:hypothetical protein I79_004881 [Cricetulus griseus]
METCPHLLFQHNANGPVAGTTESKPGLKPTFITSCDSFTDWGHEDYTNVFRGLSKI